MFWCLSFTVRNNAVLEDNITANCLVTMDTKLNRARLIKSSHVLYGISDFQLTPHSSQHKCQATLMDLGETVM